MAASQDKNYEEEKASQAQAAGDDTDKSLPGDVSYGHGEGVTELAPVDDDGGASVEASGLNPLWQSGTASTDGNGPAVEDVSHVFNEARAQALGVAAQELADGGDVPSNVVLPDDTTVPENNDEAIANLKDSAKSASEDLKASIGDNSKDNSKK
jgi:hypothetical protein